MPLGDYERSELSPDTAQYPAPANATTTLLRTDTDLPNALRAITKTSTRTTSSAEKIIDAEPYDPSVQSTRALDGNNYLAMAENAWLDQREQQNWDADHANYGQHIDNLNVQLQQARSTNDTSGIQLLTMQITQWTHQRQLAANQAADSLKRDRQAFAVWRQTNDGRHFADWVQRTFTITTWIAEVDQRWNSTWQEALNSISAEERTAYSTGVWTPRPARHTALRYLRDASVIVLLAGVVTGFVLNPAWFAVAAAGAIAAVYSMYSARDASWEQQNNEIARTARNRRSTRFGFDPLDEPNRPAPEWSAEHNPVGYAVNLQTVALDAFETHPRPETLPEPHYPVLVSTESVCVAELQQLLRSLR